MGNIDETAAAIGALRAQMAAMEKTIDGQNDQLADVRGKLDQVLQALNMGKGAWWALVKICGVVVFLVGAVKAILKYL